MNPTNQMSRQGRIGPAGWLVRAAKAALRPMYLLLPEALKTFYREYRREFPLVDRSQVVLFTDNPGLFPDYALRFTLNPPVLQGRNSLKVTLIATARNEASEVQAWLAALLGQTRLPDEIVVVDGGSTDNTLGILRANAQAFPIPLIVIEAPGANIAQGRNIAIRRASHPVVACADLHSIPDARWLELLVRPFELDDEVQLSAGYYRLMGDGRVERLSAHYFGIHPGGLDPQSFLPSSRSVAMRSAFWAIAGGYPEWLSDAGEDTLFDYQAKRQAARWAFVPEATVSWQAPDSLSKLWRKYFRYARGDGEVGVLAHHYWYKVVEALGNALRRVAILAVALLGFLFLGAWAWLPLLGLAGFFVIRFFQANLRRAGQVGTGFVPYSLFDEALGLVQLVGFGVGVANRPQVKQRQIAFYQDRLCQIIADHPDRQNVIIYPPTHDWSFMFQRPHQMATALARRGYLYFYCTINEFTDAVVGFQEVRPNLILSHVPVETFAILDRPIVYIGSPWNRSFLPAFDRPRIVYDHYDDLEVSGGRLEDHQALLESAEVVLVTSQGLLEKAAARRPDAIFAPNGVDWEAIRCQQPLPDEPPPADLAPVLELGKPLAGYAGALAEWFDYDLLLSVARACPDFQFILLGVDYDGSLGRSGVLDMENIHWLGMKPYSELFHYLWRFSLGLIPFKVNAITLATSPIKQFEYMACGLPVVATALPECRRYPEVLIAESPAQFVDHLDRALRMKSDPGYQAAIRRLVLENTWDRRVSPLVSMLEEWEEHRA